MVSVENLWDLLKEVYGDPQLNDWEVTQSWLVSRPYRNYEIYRAEVRRGSERGAIEYHKKNGKIVYVRLIGFTRGLAPRKIHAVRRKYGIKIEEGGRRRIAVLATKDQIFIRPPKTLRNFDEIAMFWAFAELLGRDLQSLAPEVGVELLREDEDVGNAVTLLDVDMKTFVDEEYGAVALEREVIDKFIKIRKGTE